MKPFSQLFLSLKKIVSRVFVCQNSKKPHGHYEIIARNSSTIGTNKNFFLHDTAFPWWVRDW